jgi:hypothetical protein
VGKSYRGNLVTVLVDEEMHFFKKKPWMDIYPS